MKKFEGKVALVTGGNSGFGYAAAQELKEQGARVIITGRRQEAVAAAARQLGVAGMGADQASVLAIKTLAEQVKQEYGTIDILFINAGVLGMSTVENASEELFDYVIDVNFKGA